MSRRKLQLRVRLQEWLAKFKWKKLNSKRLAKCFLILTTQTIQSHWIREKNSAVSYKTIGS
jgi:hypothetical protein